MDNKHGTKGNTRNTLLQGLPFCKGQGRDKHHRKEEVGKEQKIRHVQIYTYNKYVYAWYGTTCLKKSYRSCKYRKYAWKGMVDMKR